MKICKCGHDQSLHQHYRTGTDCAYSGCDCQSFRWSLFASVAAANTAPAATDPTAGTQDDTRKLSQLLADEKIQTRRLATENGVLRGQVDRLEDRLVALLACASCCCGENDDTGQWEECPVCREERL